MGNNGKMASCRNAGAKFPAPVGTMPRDGMSDFIHPTEQGCEMRAAAMQPTLTSLMQ